MLFPLQTSESHLCHEGLGGAVLSYLGLCHFKKVALLFLWGLEELGLDCKAEEYRLWSQGISLSLSVLGHKMGIIIPPLSRSQWDPSLVAVTL